MCVEYLPPVDAVTVILMPVTGLESPCVAGAVYSSRTSLTFMYLWEKKISISQQGKGSVK